MDSRASRAIAPASVLQADRSPTGNTRWGSYPNALRTSAKISAEYASDR
jgi:hypothetical protein